MGFDTWLQIVESDWVFLLQGKKVVKLDSGCDLVGCRSCFYSWGARLWIWKYSRAFLLKIWISMPPQPQMQKKDFSKECLFFVWVEFKILQFLADVVDVAPCMSHYSLFSSNENKGVLLPNVMGFLGSVSRKLLLGMPHQFGTIWFGKVLCKKTSSLSG